MMILASPPNSNCWKTLFEKNLTAGKTLSKFFSHKPTNKECHQTAHHHKENLNVITNLPIIKADSHSR